MSVLSQLWVQAGESRLDIDGSPSTFRDELALVVDIFTELRLACPEIAQDELQTLLAADKQTFGPLVTASS